MLPLLLNVHTHTRALQSYELDDQLSLGKRAGMGVKIGIAAAVNAIALAAFWKTNKHAMRSSDAIDDAGAVPTTSSFSSSSIDSTPKTPSQQRNPQSQSSLQQAGLRGALWTLAMWAAFQMFRGVVAVGGVVQTEVCARWISCSACRLSPTSDAMRPQTSSP